MSLRTCLSRTLLAVLLTASQAGSAPPNERGDARQRADERHGLRLTAKLVGGDFRLDDAVTIAIKLTNVSRRKITIYKELAWGRSASLSMAITDGEGRPVERTFIDDARHMPPFTKEDFVTIQPGKSLEIARRMTFKGAGVKSPGRYCIHIWFHSPIPAEFAPPHLKIWPSENGVLEAQKICVSVSG